MKKYLAILLAVAMLTAIFAGCGGAAGSAASASAPAEEAASAAAPAEEAAEAAEAPAEEAAPAAFTWNGQKEVWSILPTTGAEGLVWINDSMGAVMEAQGFTYVKKDAQGDPTAQEGPRQLLPGKQAPHTPCPLSHITPPCGLIEKLMRHGGHK